MKGHNDRKATVSNRCESTGMKCAKCGDEIKTGNLYCSKCGEEVQIVSAYNVMEEEFFLDFQNQEMGKNAQRGMTAAASAAQKKYLYISVLIAIVGFLMLVAVAFLVKINVDRNRSKAVTDPYCTFIQALSQSDVKKAKICLEQGMSTGSDNLSDRFWLAWFCGQQGLREEQIEILQQVLNVDDKNVYACRELIRVYVEAGDFEGLHTFYDACSDSSLTSLFADYLVEEPVIEVPSDPMFEGDSLTIRAEDGQNVYYTMDGSSPVTNGTLYYIPVKPEAGDYTIQAVACNEKGYYSRVVSQELHVETLYQLEMPAITPAGGEYLMPQTIYVDVPEGCSAYYTWNGSNPTTSSKKYRGGISMPEGNNVLSVVLVDPYGNMSSVQRVNYIYMP